MGKILGSQNYMGGCSGGSEARFSLEIFGSTLHGFLGFPSACLTRSCFQVSFPPVEVRCQSCSCPNKLMTLQMVKDDTWINKGGYRQFRGEWVSQKNSDNLLSFFTPELVFYGRFWSFCA